MVFTYKRTFLRSSLAKDPYALGNILRPEDVLRIQAEFPSLFSSSNGDEETIPEESPEGEEKSKRLQRRGTVPIPSASRIIRTSKAPLAGRGKMRQEQEVSEEDLLRQLKSLKPKQLEDLMAKVSPSLQAEIATKSNTPPKKTLEQEQMKKDKDAEIQKLNEGITTLKSDLHKALDNFAKENAKSMSLKSQLKSLHVEKVDAKRMKDLMKVLKTYQNRCKKVSQELEKVKDESGKRDLEWKRKCQRLEDEVDAMKVQLQESKSISKSNGDLLRQLKTLQESVSQAEQRLQSLRQANQSLIQKEIQLIHQYESNEQVRSLNLPKIATLEIQNEELKLKLDQICLKEVEYRANLNNMKEDKMKGEAELRNALEEMRSQKVKIEELRGSNLKLLESMNANEELVQAKTGEVEKIIATLRTTLRLMGIDYDKDNWISRLSSISQENEELRFQLSKEQEKVEKYLRENEKLKEEVERYQGLLNKTEEIFTNLQTSIEAKEEQWRRELDEKDSAIQELMQAHLHEEQGPQRDGRRFHIDEPDVHVGQGDQQIPSRGQGWIDRRPSTSAASRRPWSSPFPARVRDIKTQEKKGSPPPRPSSRRNGSDKDKEKQKTPSLSEADAEPISEATDDADTTDLDSKSFSVSVYGPISEGEFIGDIVKSPGEHSPQRQGSGRGRSPRNGRNGSVRRGVSSSIPRQR